MKKTEKTITKKMAYRGRIINVYANEVDIDGEYDQRELVEHPGGVCICALDENNDVLMVEQYRYGVQKFLLELPAGRIGINEDPMVCAQRELLEETGYHSQQFSYLGTVYPTPAYNTEKIACFLATNLTFIQQDLDPGEHLDVIKIPLLKLKEKVLNGEIQDAKTAYVILKVCAVKDV